MWNKDSLKDLVQKKFSDYQFILVSNREPYMHIYRGGEVEVIMQDYHFALLPQMLKEANPNLIVCQFWHIPWPNYEVFRSCPWGTEILEGLLGNDLLGFHLQYHCNNFFDTVDRSLETRVDYEKYAIFRQGKETRVRPFPISIDFERFENFAASEDTQAQIVQLRHRFNLSGLKVGLGVDRLDYTKGIPEAWKPSISFSRSIPSTRGVSPLSS